MYIHTYIDTYQSLKSISIICASKSEPETHTTASNNVYFCLTIIISCITDLAM